MQVLTADLERENKKEELRLRFANQAADYALWSKETADNSASTHFGFTLQEVEGFDIKGADQQVTQTSSGKIAAWKKTFEDMTNLEVSFAFQMSQESLINQSICFFVLSLSH